MLDPELLDTLAAHPEKNSPEVNVALAEQGGASVLRALVASASVGADALRVIAMRAAGEGARLELQARHEQGLGEDESAGVVDELERALIHHPAAPPEVRDSVLARHGGEPFFVLCACSHPNATLAAVEQAADWPCRAPVLERLWIALIPPEALPPLVAEEWAQDANPCRREIAARLARDGAVLERLSRDVSRQVRRALASNAAATMQRERMAREDPAVEVRARAAGVLGEHGGRVTIDSARFAAAQRAMEDGGALAADVAGALASAGRALDEEGAMWAARLLARDRVVALVQGCDCASAPSAGGDARDAEIGLGLGLGLREPAAERLGGEHEYRELVTDAAKALSHAADRFGTLTGKARLAAWIAESLAANRTLSQSVLVAELASGPIASESMVLRRSVTARSDMAEELCEAAAASAQVPPAVLELAWTGRSDDARVLAMARKCARLRARGRDLPDDEIDLDPRKRCLQTLEQVVLAACRSVTLSPRAALTVVALDSRRVRYVLTAMPAWRGSLSGAMLGRVLKQHAGALAAGRSESRHRGEQMRGWTERMLNDIELAVALAIGHITVEAMLERLQVGRHVLADGVGLAAAAEARAAVAGAEVIKPLLGWSARARSQHGAALAVWLLLEDFDRTRPATLVASAVDSLSAAGVVAPTVIEALALLERRQPGRLETVLAQTPRGRATIASALARAYRAVGGLRDERG
jgi:hypothetical protein